MSLEKEITQICAEGRKASRVLASLRRDRKDAALHAIARHLRSGATEVLEANARDIAEAKKRGVGEAMQDRLRLTPSRVSDMALSIEEVAALEDPIGQVIETKTRPNGLKVTRVRAPLGVIAMVYEARPNVAAEASALCLKAGSAVVLRGGSEAIHSNLAIGNIIARGLSETGLPEASAQILSSPDREVVRILIQQSEFIDLAIPRGGESLIRFVTENARVPVVQHYKGVCHLYLDEGADLAMALRLAMDGKLSRPSVCNALECLLVDEKDAARLLPPVLQALIAGGAEIRGCAQTRAIVPSVRPAEEADYGREFLSEVLAVRVVKGLDGALHHIAQYGSGHTEAICTNNPDSAARFRNEADAACVVVNASTRFHDGGELGLGTEIGIATSRLHWRGPMGLESLTTMKWLVDGNGQTRHDGEGA